MDKEPQQAEVVALAPYKTGVAEMVTQAASIQECMASLMKRDVHYGVIPGCEKPSLWQPGADKLCMLFRLRAEYEVTKLVEQDTWISVTMKCRLVHIPTGMCWGEGVGSANTREKRYANQTTAKVCPRCKKGAIIKGKEEYSGGWVCFKKKGGCGEKYKDGDKAIETQSGEAQVDAVWDLHNTVTKVAAKRAKVACVLTATAASDIFTQDLEDLVDLMPEPARKPATFARAAENPNAGKAQRNWTRNATPEAAGERRGAVAGGAENQGEETNQATGEVVGAKVTRSQLARIHVLKKNCGITDDDWKARLFKKFGNDANGKPIDSSAKLDVNQAAELIEALSRLWDKAREAIRTVGESLGGGADAVREMKEREPGEDDGDAPSAEEWDEMKAAMERDR